LEGVADAVAVAVGTIVWDEVSVGVRVIVALNCKVAVGVPL
jgi:hypothetical protein